MDETDDKVIVYMEDMRRLGYCSKGIRAFFMKWDLDYLTFLREGIGEDELGATGDGMALAVIQEARDGRRR